MRPKLNLEISYIQKLTSEIQHINSTPLNDIKFIDENGSEIIIDPKIISQWKNLGLNNADFITSGFYLNGWKQINEDL